MYFFQKFPDGIIIFLGHGEVGIIPIHPVSQTFGLFRLDARIFDDPFFTFVDEIFNPVSFNISLGLKPQFFFNFHLDP